MEHLRHFGDGLAWCRRSPKIGGESFGRGFKPPVEGLLATLWSIQAFHMDQLRNRKKLVDSACIVDQPLTEKTTGAFWPRVVLHALPLALVHARAWMA